MTLAKGAFMTWVTTITRNLLVDHFRKTKQDRMTDSMDTAASEHEDAQPLSEQIPDQACPPGRPRAEPGGLGDRARGLGQAIARTSGSSDSKGLTGYGLPRNCHRFEGSGGYREITE